MNIQLRGALLCALILSGTPAAAEPLLWRVSDADSSVHLFGSVHILKAGTDWRSDQFEAVLAAAEYVYFEIDLGTDGMVAAGELMIEKGSFPAGQTIADVLTVEEHAQLMDFLSTSGIPPTTVEHLQPWLMELSLGYNLGGGSEMFEGYDPGVDFILSAEIPMERQRALETLEEQLGGLYNRPMEDQVASLMDALALAEESSGMDDLESIEHLFAAWEQGDGEGIDFLVNSMLGGPEAYMYDAFLTKRNMRWTDKIEGMLADNVAALVVGGAGHFVGPTSVTALLEERGYTIELISEPFVPRAPSELTRRSQQW